MKQHGGPDELSHESFIHKRKQNKERTYNYAHDLSSTVSPRLEEEAEDAVSSRKRNIPRNIDEILSTIT